MSPQSTSGERTERATPKKRKDARERGQVFKSTEVNTALSNLVIFGFMIVFLPSFLEQLAAIMKNYLSGGLWDEINAAVDVRSLGVLFLNLLARCAGIILPVLLCAMLVGLVSNILQVGFLFTTKPLAPKLERISPLKGFKRIFSMRTLTELVKSILKIICLGVILYSDFKSLVVTLPGLTGAELYTSFTEALLIAFRLALKMSLTLAIIAVFDFLFQWWNYEKELRMTKQEVKDEYKLIEGDPQIKGRIRQKQRQMSAMRMMQQVPSADVVITNPTHFAVALTYEEGEAAAPVVVAKGQDYLALKIKSVAAENGVEMVENRALARSLYMTCDVGSEIPAEFYQAVADILVYVYRQKNKLRR